MSERSRYLLTALVPGPAIITPWELRRALISNAPAARSRTILDAMIPSPMPPGSVPPPREVREWRPLDDVRPALWQIGERDLQTQAYSISEWLRLTGEAVPHNAPRFTIQTVVPGLPPSELAVLRGPLFKFLKRKNADDMRARGNVRVGTLFGYRDVAQFGPEIGDEDEGMRDARDGQFHVSSANPRTHSALVRRMYRGIEHAHGFKVIGIDIRERFVAEDMYVFSTVEHFSPDGYTAFGAGYDTCLRIDNPAGFFAVLEAGLRGHRGVSGAAVARCRYGPRTRLAAADDGRHPATLKAQAYAGQHEVRGMWSTTDDPPAACIFDCPELAGFVTLHHQI